MRSIGLYVKMIALALIAVLSLAACSSGETNKPGNGGTATSDAGQQPGKEAEKEKENEDVNQASDEKYKNIDLKFYVQWVPTEQQLAKFNKAGDAWVKDYGGSFTIINAPDWSQHNSKLLTLIATGDSPDISTSGSADIPEMLVKNAFMPIDEYLNSNNPYSDVKLTDAAYKWGDKRYGFSTNAPDVVVLMYNKTMFKENGLATPTELYQEGKWNWDTFREAAIALTQDTNNDGKTDQWGYGSWMDEVFFITNGVPDLIKVAEDGKVSPATDDPRFVEAAEFLQDLTLKNKVVFPEQWGGPEGFKNRKIAMMIDRSWVLAPIINQGFQDEWDVVPLPKGRSAEAHVNYVAPGGASVVTGSKHPEAAAKFIQEYLLKAYDDEAKNPVYPDIWQGWSPEQQQLFADMNANLAAVTPKYQGFGQLDGHKTNFFDEIKNQGKSVSSTVEKYNPLFQAQIDLTMSGTE
ncbi:extracellular solute-binding protein [Paenibacillus sp. GCM10027626]|uniref:ABC transporter substrate-binding protein n=1 Tax=Paenibacillus sp. GCM10027626 TaxID=3273411 RepID=UPI00362A5F11